MMEHVLRNVAFGEFHYCLSTVWGKPRWPGCHHTVWYVGTVTVDFVLSEVSLWSTRLHIDISGRGTKTKPMFYCLWLLHVKFSLPQWMLERQLSMKQRMYMHICCYYFGISFCGFAYSPICTYNLKVNTCGMSTTSCGHIPKQPMFWVSQSTRLPRNVKADDPVFIVCSMS